MSDYKPRPPIPETKKTPERAKRPPFEKYTMKKKRGGQTIRTPEIEEAILSDIERGLSVGKACNNNNITARTWYRWVDDDADLCHKYARAKDIQADICVDEMEAVVRDVKTDPVRGRLIYDFLKWKASHFSPKKYGDKTAVQLEGKQDINVRILTADEMGDGNND